MNARHPSSVGAAPERSRAQLSRRSGASGDGTCDGSITPASSSCIRIMPASDLDRRPTGLDHKASRTHGTAGSRSWNRSRNLRIGSRPEATAGAYRAAAGGSAPRELERKYTTSTARCNSLPIRLANDRSATGGQHIRSRLQQAREHRLLDVAKRRLAVLLEIGADRTAELALDLGVGVGEPPAQSACELAPDTWTSRFQACRPSDNGHGCTAPQRAERQPAAGALDCMRAQRAAVRSVTIFGRQEHQQLGLVGRTHRVLEQVAEVRGYRPAAAPC